MRRGRKASAGGEQAFPPSPSQTPLLPRVSFAPGSCRNPEAQSALGKPGGSRPEPQAYGMASLPRLGVPATLPAPQHDRGGGFPAPGRPSGPRAQGQSEARARGPRALLRAAVPRMGTSLFASGAPTVNPYGNHGPKVKSGVLQNQQRFYCCLILYIRPSERHPPERGSAWWGPFSCPAIPLPHMCVCVNSSSSREGWPRSLPFA